QSNLGVVTKIGVWLMPEPEMYSPVDIGVDREEDIVALIDTLRPLRLDGTIPATVIANWMRIVATHTTRAQWYDGKDAMPPSAIASAPRCSRPTGSTTTAALPRRRRAPSSTPARSSSTAATRG